MTSPRAADVVRLANTPGFEAIRSINRDARTGNDVAPVTIDFRHALRGWRAERPPHDDGVAFHEFIEGVTNDRAQDLAAL